jgi:pathogenesis-related protein 1
MGRKSKRGRLSAGNGAACLFAAITWLGCRAADEGTSRNALSLPALRTAGAQPDAGSAGVMASTGPAGAAGLPAAGSGERGPVAASGGSLDQAGVETGAAGAAGASVSMGETGRMVGMTAAHNAVRAMVQTTPVLPPMIWSPTLAAYAQEWTDNLAKTACTQPQHRSSQELQAKGYGENLAMSGGSRPPMTSAQFAVDGWAGEVACWSYGTIAAPGFAGSEKCDSACYQKLNSDGCGHYTQLVWRNSTQLGCGVSSCTSGGVTYDIWICNYAPTGNVVGQKPY